MTATCDHRILDRDFDGFAPPVCGGLDCNDAERSIHPDAIELCNEVDDDCDEIVDDGVDLTTREDCGACGNRCDDRENCAGADCVPCGDLDAPCCEAGGAECYGITRCGDDGLCELFCGRVGEPCCAGGTCARGNVCPNSMICVERTACSSDECDLVHNGCPAGEGCFFEPPTPGAAPDYVCRPQLSLPPGATWDRVCVTNRDCFQNWACVDGFCEISCCEDIPPMTPDGCGSGLTCSAPGPSGPIGECATICDPITGAGCAAGDVCALELFGASCWPLIDPRGEGEVCDGLNNCPTGLSCTFSVPPSRCLRVCRLDGSTSCPAGTTCRADYPDAYIYGTCR